MLNKRNNNGKNTALHIAAGNVNVSAAFVDKLKSANARFQNSKGDTPFHVAAKSSNPNTIIHLLNTFAPSKFGWDIDDVDRYRHQDRKTVLSICACSGNAEAVALLIQHGANLSKDVLRDIVSKSVECPEKTEQLLAVYRVIVDNAVTWRCLEENVKLITKESRQYDECLRQTMMWLITRPDEPKLNVIKCAIETGAWKMLDEILNTRGVFRFDSVEKKETWYDVTNFVPRVRKVTDDGSLKSKSKYLEQYPQKPTSSYIFSLTNNHAKWEEEPIFQKEPINGLTEPYILFTQICYFIVAVVQLIYMICFSICYVPTTCSLIELFKVSANSSCDNSSSDAQSAPLSPPWPWLVWPAIMFAYGLYTFFVTISSVIAVAVIIVINIYKRFKDESRYSFKPTKFLMSFGLFTSFSFCISLLFWNIEYSNENYSAYVKSTSMVLLFGWIMDFFFFSKTTKKFCIFSQVLREIIIKDIAMSFLLLFLFTFLGFSFAMHTLRMSELPSDDVVYLGATVYDVFIAGLGTGDYFQAARDERSRAGIDLDLFEAVVIIYITVTAIILLNVLIAMINNRYDKAMQRAENHRRFWILEIAIRGTTPLPCIYNAFRRLLAMCRRHDQVGLNNTQSFCCFCGLRCFCCRNKQCQEDSDNSSPIPRGRSVLKVKWP